MAHHRSSELRSLVLKIADSAQAGLDQMRGGMFYEGDTRSGEPTVMTKVWWVQAEAAVGYLNAHLLSREEKYLVAARDVLRWILQEQVDYVGLEWFDKIEVNGRKGKEKASVWKASYHTGRALLMLLPQADLFAALADRFKDRLR